MFCQLVDTAVQKVYHAQWGIYFEKYKAQFLVYIARCQSNDIEFKKSRAGYPEVKLQYRQGYFHFLRDIEGNLSLYVN